MSTESFASADFSDKARGYRDLLAQIDALLTGEKDLIANAANIAALLYHSLPRINWAGFYFLRQEQALPKAGLVGDQLVLGPFQGKPACVRIALGHGVCGTAAASRQTVVVPD